MITQEEKERRETVKQLTDSIITHIESIEVLNTAPNPSPRESVENYINAAIAILKNETISHMDRLEPFIEEANRNIAITFNNILDKLNIDSDAIVPSARLRIAHSAIRNIKLKQFYIDDVKRLHNSIVNHLYVNPKDGTDASNKRTEFWDNIISSTLLEALEDVVEYHSQITELKEILTETDKKIETNIKEAYDTIEREFKH